MLLFFFDVFVVFCCFRYHVFFIYLYFKRKAPHRNLKKETYRKVVLWLQVFPKYAPVTGARENHTHPQVHPSNSSRDVVARCLIMRSGVYFARHCTPARIGSKMECKRGEAETKRGMREQRVFILQTPVLLQRTLKGRFLSAIPPMPWNITHRCSTACKHTNTLS